MPPELTFPMHARSKTNLRVIVPGVALVIAFALLYLWTLDDGLRPAELEGGDLITHQYAQVQGRPSNAPGYPLYTMGGWLWFRLGRLIAGPAANPIPILSSYSTLWALVALWLLYRLILEVTGEQHRPLALLGTAFYGVTYFFWYYAVTTEQYTSSVAWTLAVLLLAFRWERLRRPDPSAEPDPATSRAGDRFLLALAALAGIGLAHQITVLFVIPPLLWFVLRRQPGLLRRPRFIAAAVGVALLPLLSYAYIYVRGAQHPEWRGAGQWDSAAAWFFSFISTSQGRGELTWSLQPFLTAEFPSLIWGEMSWPGLVIGLLGLAAAGRRRAAVLYATLIIYVAFCWVDRLGNWYQVIMPVYALLVVGLAAAAAWIWRGPGRPRIPAAVLPYVRGLILAGLVALVAWRGILSYPRADSSHRPEDTGLLPAQAILADDPPPGTAVFGTTPEALALSYVTQIWGARADLRAVRSDEARALLLQGGALTATTGALPLVPAEVSSAARYSALGRTLVELRLKPRTSLPGGLQQQVHDFGPLRLAGFRAGKNPVTGELVVLLAWQARLPAGEDWSVSVRLTADGREIAQVDAVHPVGGAYPTSRWLPGEVILDAYPFALEHEEAPDGATVILYRPDAAGGFVNLGQARLSF